MKIAVYHNLEKGGALNLLIELIKNLKKDNSIDLYCHQLNISETLFNKTYLYKLKKTSNIFTHIQQILFELKETNQKIALDIDKQNYDLVLIFQCILIQSPYLLRFLSKNTKSVYFWNEPKREFYEKTSFDHSSLKRTLARLIRLPIKYIDKYNCKQAKLIITCSSYASKQLLKIYGKKSFVVHPGLKPIKPKKITIKNNKKFVSIGPFLKIKGHTFSINQLKGFTDKFTIIGRKTHEYSIIKKEAVKNKIKINKIDTEDDQKKILELKKHTFYLANNENEPFGIATLEATDNNLFVLGKDQGGTREIIQNGKNGILYPDNLDSARTAINKLLKLKYISFYKICTTDWKYYTNKVLKYANTQQN
jgi:glycosyltransferase involved in cell wall biosynthesis